MRRYLSFIFLLVSAVVSGQNDLSRKDSIAIFGPTEKGIPDGEKLSRDIGSEGGKLLSADGKVELIISAGTLSSNTTISIQPITNLAQGGAGKAYNLEPSGIQFNKPVQLIFHYSDKETEGDSPNLLRIATQDEKGVWQGLKKIKLDTIAKTLSGNINHFSSWGMSWAIILQPVKTRVKVSGVVRIYLYAKEVFNNEFDSKEHQAVLDAYFGVDFKNPRIWTVNDIPDGDNSVGKIIHRGSGLMSVDFKAPVQVPDNNPVVITVEIQGMELFDKIVNYKKSCKILIYDNRYEVKMISKMDGPAGTLLGDMSYSDEGSFIVSLEGKESKITDIKNNTEQLIYKGSCKTELMNPGRNTGMIHINGIPSIKITPAQPPGQEFPIVEITFVQSMAINSSLKFTCPKIPPTLLPTMGVPTLPYRIKFTAKEGEQVIKDFGERRGEERVYYKFTVKQLKED